MLTWELHLFHVIKGLLSLQQIWITPILHQNTFVHQTTLTFKILLFVKILLTNKRIRKDQIMPILVCVWNLF